MAPCTGFEPATPSGHGFQDRFLTTRTHGIFPDILIAGIPSGWAPLISPWRACPHRTNGRPPRIRTLTNWVGASHATVTLETYVFGVGAATRTRTVLRLATLAGW